MQLLWYNSEIYIINVIYLVLKLMSIINVIIKRKLNINLIIINSNSYKIIYKYRLIVPFKFFFVYNFSIRQ